MENNKIKKENIIVPLISALLIVIAGRLNIDGYFKDVVFPFMILLIGCIYLVENNKYINKKAYYMFIPIVLILISDFLLKIFNTSIDFNNVFLNIILLPVLISIFLFLLTNENYKISLNNLSLVFKLFPSGLFSNLKFLKHKPKDNRLNNLLKIIFGSAIGLLIASIIMVLLISADDYFKRFIGKLTISFNLDIGNIIKFIIYFIVLFSIGINVIKNVNLKIKEEKYKNPDNTMIISMLSVINFVFVLFLFSEISKLCGNFLRIPSGYIYSSYAREGFFQLLFVTIINFIIITYLLYKTKSVEQNKFVKYLILTLIAFTILLIFNSYYRMFLYIGHYGFTVLRLQVILFLLMELILFAIIIKRVVSNIKNENILFLIIMTTIYIINLYTCNDWFINVLNKL